MMKKSILILLLATILLLTGLYTPQVHGASAPETSELPSGSTEIYQGIDVSQWQGYINFNRAFPAGLIRSAPAIH